MSRVLDGPALRCDPGEVEFLAMQVGAAANEGEVLVAQLEGLVASYAADQAGPDIDVIVASAGEVTAGMRSTFGAFREVETGLSSQVGVLGALSVESQRLWNEVGVLPPDAELVEVAALQGRFDRIRAGEDDCLGRVAAAMEAVPRGVDVVVDTAAIGGVIDRAMQLTGDRVLRFELAAGMALAADYGADRSFEFAGGLGDAFRDRDLRLQRLGMTDEETRFGLATGPPLVVRSMLSLLEGPGARYDSVDALVDDMMAAIADGRTPAEAGLPDVLFPPGYVTRSRAGGNPRTTMGAAAVAVIDRTGAERLGVARFAAVLGDRCCLPPVLSNPGDATATFTASEVGLGEVSPLLADDAGLAVVFFNELGPEQSARLVLTYDSASDRAFKELAAGLGSAAATGGLSFTGAEYVRAGAGPEGHQYRSPLQLLAISDTIPDEFLVSATAESLLLAEEYLPLGRYRSPLHGEPGRWFSSVNLMGPGGPYPSTMGDAEDANLVMLAMISERDPAATLELMNALGVDQADALLRYDQVIGDQPAGWDLGSDGNGPSRLTELLWRAADPAQTGDPALSDLAATWIIEGAGTPGPGYALAVRPDAGHAIELVLIDRHTVMVGAGLADSFYADGGIELTDFDRQFSEDVIDDATESVFRGGAGAGLLTFQNGLIRDGVHEALLDGDGDPDALRDLQWLGRIDGRIDGAAERSAIADAQTLDARNELIQSYIGTVVESIPGAGAGRLAIPQAQNVAVGAGSDQAVGWGLGLAEERGRFFPTDNELGAWRERWGNENLEAELHRASMVAALQDAGRIQYPAAYLDRFAVGEPYLPPPFELANNEGWSKTRIPILDSNGQQATDTYGRPITLKDWLKGMGDYHVGNNRVERAGE